MQDIRFLINTLLCRHSLKLNAHAVLYTIAALITVLTTIVIYFVHILNTVSKRVSNKYSGLQAVLHGKPDGQENGYLDACSAACDGVSTCYQRY